MINFSLMMTPESTITLNALWDRALPAVIQQLNDCGYTVDQADTAEAVGLHGFLRHYHLKPGPATLTATADDSGAGSIQFILDGSTFGTRRRSQEADPVLWMRLVTLGVQCAGTYMVVPNVVDPDDPTG
jgi:hypothetical protein